MLDQLIWRADLRMKAGNLDRSLRYELLWSLCMFCSKLPKEVSSNYGYLDISNDKNALKGVAETKFQHE